VERADGNALYLEELIRAHARAQGRAARNRARDAAIPAREPRADARRLLRAASVFGGSFWAGGVYELLGSGLWRESQDCSRCCPTRGHFAPPDLAFRAKTSTCFVTRSGATRRTRRSRPKIASSGTAWRARGFSRPASAIPSRSRCTSSVARAELARAQVARAAELALDGNDFLTCLEHAERAVALGATGEFLAAQAHPGRSSALERQAGGSRSLGSEALSLLPSRHRVGTTRSPSCRRQEPTRRRRRSARALRAGANARRARGLARSQLVAWVRLAGALMLSGRFELVDALLAERARWPARCCRRPAVTSACTTPKRCWRFGAGFRGRTPSLG